MARWCTMRLGVNFVVEMCGNDLVRNQRRKDWGRRTVMYVSERR